MQTHRFSYKNVEARLCGTDLLAPQEGKHYTIGIFQQAASVDGHEWAIAYFKRDEVDWNLTFIGDRPFASSEDFMFVAKEGYDFLVAYEKVNGWLSGIS